MRIGLITDPIIDKPTGVSNYTKYVASKLTYIDSENSYIFIDYKKNDLNKNNLLYINNPFKFLKTYLWHNILPLIMRKYDMDFLFNFHSAPHLIKYRQKEVFFIYDLSWYHFPQYHPLGRVILFNLFFKKSLSNSYKIIADSYDA